MQIRLISRQLSNFRLFPMLTTAHSHPHYLRKSTWAIGMATLLLAFSACKKNKPLDAGNETHADEQAQIVVSVKQNNLGTKQSSLLATASKSPIHWQPWNSRVFENAKQDHKTVFAVIGSGHEPETVALLEQLNQSLPTCKILNSHHINVIIDSSHDPAMEFLTSSLCLASREYIQGPPLLIWFSYNGHPISWRSAHTHSNTNISELISTMSRTIHRMWKDDAEYVLNNSKLDFNKRWSALIHNGANKWNSQLPSQAIRQISSYYDPTSNNIDKIGRLSAARYVNLLIKASTSGAVTKSQQLRYGGIARISAQSTLIYGLIDPLDGGVYNGVQRTSLSLPIFAKSLKTQALSMAALYNLYQLTEDEIYLKSADDIKAYTEKSLRQSSGDYSQGIVYQKNNTAGNQCTWTLEELETALTEEELRVCKYAFDIRGLGNVPLIDDTDRNYFRENTLTWKTTRAKLAKKTNFDRNQLNTLLESIVKKLGKIRTDRGPMIFRENLCSSKSLSLYTSALITAYRATGDESHLKDALRVIEHIKDNFTGESGWLHESSFYGKLSSTKASATTHALICNAALDIHECTANPSYLQMARDIHTQMGNKLSGEVEYPLHEYDFSLFPTQYHVAHSHTIPNINNFSSWVLAWSNSKRILKYDDDQYLRKQMVALENSLSKQANLPAIMLVDYLTTYFTLENTKVYHHGEANDGLHTTAIRRPCQIIIMSKNTHPDLNEKVPKGSAAVVYRGKLVGVTSQASELRNWLK